MGDGPAEGEVDPRLPQLFHHQKPRLIQKRRTQPQDRTKHVLRKVERRVELPQVGGSASENAQRRHPVGGVPVRKNEARVAKSQRTQQQLSGTAAIAGIAYPRLDKAVDFGVSPTYDAEEVASLASHGRSTPMSTKTRSDVAWPIRCAQCGTGDIAPMARPGRTARYKTVAALAIPEDLEIPTCEVCGAEWIDEKTAAAVDAALESAYQRRLRAMAAGELQKLAAQRVTQRRIERLLGLSQGYLSKIRSGVSNPSPMLVGLLHLLASDPERRLREVEESFGSV